MAEIKVHPDISWIINTEGVSIHHRLRGECSHFDLPEAIVWDLVQRHKNLSGKMDLLQAVFPEKDDPAGFVQSCLEQWRRREYLL